MPGWLILCVIYVSWNICGYVEKELFPNSFLADCAYWVHERIFVIACFWLMVQYLRKSVYKNYVWVAKTFMLIGVAKLIYVLLVLTEVLRINERWVLMGFIFSIGLGYIIARWEKQRKY